MPKFIVLRMQSICIEAPSRKAAERATIDWSKAAESSTEDVEPVDAEDEDSMYTEATVAEDGTVTYVSSSDQFCAICGQSLDGYRSSGKAAGDCLGCCAPNGKASDR